MSRSGYDDSCDYDRWQLICWRGAVASAIRGRRGQSFLNELISALDALPEKKLIIEKLEDGGEVCAIGAVGRARGLSMVGVDPENSERVASIFGISDAMVREITYVNDDEFLRRTPEERFAVVRRWAKDKIWGARGCVDDPYDRRALGMSKRLHWNAVIEWNEI